VKINVMLDAIASAENIEVTEEEINEEYNNMAQRYGMDVEKIKTYFKAEELKGDMQMRKAAKLVAESAVVAAPKTEE
jgi:trigger factor